MKIAYFQIRKEKTAVEYYRVIAPLKAAGITRVSGIEENTVLPETIETCDLVLLNRDFPRSFKNYQIVLDYAHRYGKPIVLDMDDHLLALPENHIHRIEGSYADALLPIMHALYTADAITVTTPYLRKVLTRYNKNIHVLPNYLDETIWHFREPLQTPAENLPLTIMYMGTQTHKEDAVEIVEVLKTVLERYGAKINLKFYGMDPPESLLGLSNVSSLPFGPYEFVDFAQGLVELSADIGIAPLADHPFNRSKSGIKYFEYTAMGIPGIYSALEPYTETIKPGQTGFLAHSSMEWLEYLTAVIEAPDLRKQIAENAQDDVQKNWFLGMHADKWISTYQEIVHNYSRNKADYPEFLSDINTIAEQLNVFHRQRAEQVFMLEKEVENQQKTRAELEKEVENQQKTRAELEQALKNQASIYENLEETFLKQSLTLQTIQAALTSEKSLREKAELTSDYWIIKNSGLFDETFYLSHNEDVRTADMDPIRHYVIFGWKEGRDPNPNFDTSYYLQGNPDVVDAKSNPFVHYIRFGRKENRLSRESLQTAAQLHQLPLKGQIERIKRSCSIRSLNLVERIRKGLRYIKTHSLRQSFERAKMELAPRPNFKPMVARPSDPMDLEKKSNQSNKLYQTLFQTAKGLEPDYVPLKKKTPLQDLPVKLIAFYLPQFHPFPENDVWWGKGFTEWTNVSKAVPQFEGHYQPHLPGELGFYDLRVPEVQERQVELAKQHGLYGFCFHYYWFSGKRLLEKPLDSFVNNPNINFPFCLCWANENWTRRWDGLDHDILIGQEHSYENDQKFIVDLVPYLKHRNYICINGRPLVVIYRAELMKDPKATLAYWREHCRNQGVGEPLFVAVEAFGVTNPEKLGFDAGLEFPPLNRPYTGINEHISFYNPDYAGVVYDYRDMVIENVQPLKRQGVTFRGVTPGWDNEARKPGKGFSFIHSTPTFYQRWLEQVSLEQTRKFPQEERLIFINAWNEWAEGAHLEPDRKFGYGYLQATRDALENVALLHFQNAKGSVVENPVRKNENAVVIHAYYLEMLEKIRDYLDHIGCKLDVYISTPKQDEKSLKTIFGLFPEAYLMIVPNRGRDIGPFIEIFRRIRHLKYQTLLKIHTKKSAHREDGDKWRKDIYDKLLTPLGAKNAIEELVNNESIGIIGPQAHVLDYRYYWGSNRRQTLELARQLGVASEGSEPKFNFVAGTMFWAKPEALAVLDLLPHNIMSFSEEPIPEDGTLAHVMERLICLAAKSNGFEVMEIDKNGKIQTPVPNLNFEFAEPTLIRLEEPTENLNLGGGELSSASPALKVAFSNEGYCYCCDQDTLFISKDTWFRDNYICTKCGSIPRERALMLCIDKYFPNWRELTIHESSPAVRGASERLRNNGKNYIPSQYFEGIKSGEMHKGFLCEDLENLSFEDNSIDLHVTQDVFEHLFDPQKAFQEIARTLKPGGAHIFTTPLINKDKPTQFCAVRGVNGAVTDRNVPKEYHGNPVSTEGSLVTVHWGYDITHYIQAACGLSTQIVYLDDLQYGIRAEFIEVLITRKPL